MTASPNALRTYHMEPLRRRLFFAVAAVIAVIGLLFGAFALWLLGSLAPGLEPLDFVFAGVPTLGLLALAAAIMQAARTIRLELSEEGVALHLPGALVEAGWESVAAFLPVPLGVLSGEALILHCPAAVRTAWWFRLIAPVGFERAIPLAPFALPVRGSRLEAELRGPLPGVFDRADATLRAR